MGVEASFGRFATPAPLWRSLTNDGQVVVLRQYRFAVQARLLEFPAGTLEEEKIRIHAAGTGRRGGLQRRRWDPWARCCLARGIPMR